MWKRSKANITLTLGINDLVHTLTKPSECKAIIVVKYDYNDIMALTFLKSQAIVSSKNLYLDISYFYFCERTSERFYPNLKVSVSLVRPQFTRQRFPTSETEVKAPLPLPPRVMIFHLPCQRAWAEIDRSSRSHVIDWPDAVAMETAVSLVASDAGDRKSIIWSDWPLLGCCVVACS